MLFRSFVQLVASPPTLGGWMSLGDPAVATILARSGIDWLVLDAEHGMFSRSDIRACLEASQALSIPTLVRVPANDATELKLTLDLGPDGVVIPMVNSRSDAEAAVQACHYPPAGRRGYGAGRAARYGLDYEEYREAANSELAVVLQVEHADAVASVGEIASTPGVSALFVGPTDLSASMGLLGREGDSRIEDAIDHVVAAGRVAGVPVGCFSGSEEQAIERIRRGVAFTVWTSDVGLIAWAARATVGRVRREVGYGTSAASRTGRSG